MAAILVTGGELVTLDDGGGQALRMDYDLPGIDPPGPNHGGHQHYLPVVAVWLRMAEYGVTKAEAIELAILELAAPDLLRPWPYTNAQRAGARGRHTVVLAKKYRDLVPDPSPEEQEVVARVTTAGRAAVAKARADESAARRAQTEARDLVLGRAESRAWPR